MACERRTDWYILDVILALPTYAPGSDEHLRAVCRKVVGEGGVAGGR